MTVRVLLAGGPGLVRQGLRSVLSAESDLQVVGEAREGQDPAALEADVAVVIADGAPTPDRGLNVARAIKQTWRHGRVLILSSHPDQEHFRQAMAAGAAGYELMDISSSHLANAIRAVHSGKTAINQDVLKQMAEGLARPEHASAPAMLPQGTLTQRELQVLTKVAEGLGDKEIAAQLFLSEATVKSHLRAIYSKLQIHCRTQAATLALQWGLIVPHSNSHDRQGPRHLPFVTARSARVPGLLKFKGPKDQC